ncbi:MAG: hypothetical protein V7686_08020 [Qipengyuania sp.]
MADTTKHLMAALVLAGLPGVALAQPGANEPAGPADQEGILVEGQRAMPAPARETARAVVRNTGLVRGDRPIARWRERLCIDVIGIEPAAREMVAQRIADYAETLELEARTDQSCQTNVSVAFTFGAAALVEKVRIRKPKQFREVPAYHADVVFGEAAPVRAWYRTEWRDRNGRAAGGIQPASVTVGGVSWSGEMPNKDDAPITTGISKSRVQTDATRSIEAAMIIVDRDLAAGYRVDEIADLITLLALAELYPREIDPESNSILSLFETPNSELRGGMSRCDRVLLDELYALPAARTSRVQRGALVKALADVPDCSAG